MDFGPVLLNVCRRKSDLRRANSPPTRRFNPIYLDFPNETTGGGGADGFSFIDAEDLQEQLQSHSQTATLDNSQLGADPLKKLPLPTDNSATLYGSDHIYEEIGGNGGMLPSTSVASVVEPTGTESTGTADGGDKLNPMPNGKLNVSPRKSPLNSFAKDNYNSWSEGMTGVKSKSLRNVFVIQENSSGDATDQNVLKIHRGLTRVVSPKKPSAEETAKLIEESMSVEKNLSTARNSTSPRQSSSSCDSGRPMSYASTASSNSSATSSCRGSQVDQNDENLLPMDANGNQASGRLTAELEFTDRSKLGDYDNINEYQRFLLKTTEIDTSAEPTNKPTSRSGDLCGRLFNDDAISSPRKQILLGQGDQISYLDRILIEVVETERAYVNDLNAVIEGYLGFLMREREELGVTPVEICDLFGNIEEIFEFNRSFYLSLDKCELELLNVTNCFIEHAEGFSVYTDYCTGYPKIVSTLENLLKRSTFHEALRGRQQLLNHSLPLGAFLLKPVQRVLKYHLFLQNMLKHCQPDSSPAVQSALKRMTTIAQHINEAKRKREHSARVKEIQKALHGWDKRKRADLTHYGELILEGSFVVVGAKNCRNLFLFEKVLLMTKTTPSGSLVVKDFIMVSNLMLIESVAGNPLAFHIVPFDNPKLQFTVQANTLEQKREWAHELKRLIMAQFGDAIPIHAREIVMHMGDDLTEEAAKTERYNNQTIGKKCHPLPKYLEKRRKSTETANKVQKPPKKYLRSLTSGELLLRRHSLNPSAAEKKLRREKKVQNFFQHRRSMDGRMVSVSMTPEGDSANPQTSRSEAGLEASASVSSEVPLVTKKISDTNESEDFPLPKAEISIGSFTTAFDTAKHKLVETKVAECQTSKGTDAGQVPEMKEWLKALKRSDDHCQTTESQTTGDAKLNPRQLHLKPLSRKSSSNKSQEIQESLVQAEIVYDQLWKEIEHFASTQTTATDLDEGDLKLNNGGGERRWKLRKFPVFDDALWDTCCEQCNGHRSSGTQPNVCSKAATTPTIYGAKLNSNGNSSNAIGKSASSKEKNLSKGSLKTCGSQRVLAVRFADRHVKKNKSDSDLRIHRVNPTGSDKVSPTNTFATFAMRAGGKAKEAVDRLTDLLTSFGSNESKKDSNGSDVSSSLQRPQSLSNLQLKNCETLVSPSDSLAKGRDFLRQLLLTGNSKEDRHSESLSVDTDEESSAESLYEGSFEFELEKFLETDGCCDSAIFSDEELDLVDNLRSNPNADRFSQTDQIAKEFARFKDRVNIRETVQKWEEQSKKGRLGSIRSQLKRNPSLVKRSLLHFEKNQQSRLVQERLNQLTSSGHSNNQPIKGVINDLIGSVPVKERTKQLRAVNEPVQTNDNERRAQELREVQRLKRINTLSPEFDNVPSRIAPSAELKTVEVKKEEVKPTVEPIADSITSPTDEALQSIAGYVKSMIDRLEHP